MSGFYSPNPHDASGLPGTEDLERVERCNAEAGRYFFNATQPQHQAFRDRMAYIAAWKGSPRWERDRDAAKAKFREDTAVARELCDRTFNELMESGEISEELSAAWDAPDTSRFITVGDHTPELRRAS